MSDVVGMLIGYVFSVVTLIWVSWPPRAYRKDNTFPSYASCVFVCLTFIPVIVLYTGPYSFIAVPFMYWVLKWLALP